MPLDLLTLQAQLAVHEKSAATLDAAIMERTNQLQAVTIDLERTRGARQWQNVVIDQTKQLIENAQKELAAQPAAVSVLSP